MKGKKREFERVNSQRLEHAVHQKEEAVRKIVLRVQIRGERKSQTSQHEG